jgi:hypothetical protein
MREGGRDCASGRVAIYDARGRKVREIPGSVFSRDGATWRGETGDGTSVAAGVYVWVQTCYDRGEPSRPCTGKITLLR